jgi:hypothetical protein
MRQIRFPAGASLAARRHLALVAGGGLLLLIGQGRPPSAVGLPPWPRAAPGDELRPCSEGSHSHSLSHSLSDPGENPPPPEVRRLFEPAEDEMGRIHQQLTEEELAKWKPGPENRHTPRASLRDPGAPVGGLWTRGGGFESTTLYVEWTGRPTCAGSRPCRIYFYSGGCGGCWSLRRTGLYSADGTLSLDRPVEDYSSPAYQRLFAMRVAGQSCLVPDASVVAVEQVAAGRDLNGSRIPWPFTARDVLPLFCLGRPEPGGRW